jgi:hypothetical protein
MPTVSELSAPYGNFMLGPRRGPDVCSACFNLIDRSGRCYGCERGPGGLDAMAPISYSVGGEQLHHALAGYKRLSGNPARQFQMELAAVLWRYLAAHERCLALAAGVDAFAIVTTVPSSQTERATTHPLPLLVADLVGPARERYVRLLERTGRPAPPHRFSIGKYAAREDLAGRPVLLIDDTWTTGANAQSAAAALKATGAGSVAAVVIGRFVNRGWHHNDRHLRDLAQPFDWNRCALCADQETAVTRVGTRVGIPPSTRSGVREATRRER